MTSYNNDFDDDFSLPPEMDADYSLPDRPRPSTTTNTRPLSPIQIDQEVTVKQKRKPAVKLIDRLVSDRGLKHLRREAPNHLKFKGKGHEKQDLQRLLNYYQLWMHDVFPKARFRDCIAMTEKVGHLAQVRIMRQQWIDETKPKIQRDEDDDLDLDGAEVLESIEREQAGDDEAMVSETHREGEGEAREKSAEDGPLFVDDDDMSDFDMDELLGTQKQRETMEAGKSSDDVAAAKSAEKDEFEDEMDAMKDIDDFF